MKFTSAAHSALRDQVTRLLQTLNHSGLTSQKPTIRAAMTVVKNMRLRRRLSRGGRGLDTEGSWKEFKQAF